MWSKRPNMFGESAHCWNDGNPWRGVDEVKGSESCTGHRCPQVKMYMHPKFVRFTLTNHSQVCWKPRCHNSNQNILIHRLVNSAGVSQECSLVQFQRRQCWCLCAPIVHRSDQWKAQDWRVHWKRQYVNFQLKEYCQLCRSVETVCLWHPRQND